MTPQRKPMFNTPNQDEVRRFWCQTAAKVQANQAMDAMETIAGLWLEHHPEYQPDLQDANAAVARDYAVAEGKTNPFLHLSMHLSISEQCSIDQPRGIRAAVERLSARTDDLHEAHHAVMEALGDMLWTSQRNQQAPDGQAYVEAVQRRALRD